MSTETPVAVPQKGNYLVTSLALVVAVFAMYGWQQADKRAFNAVAISGNGQMMQKVVRAVTQIDQAVGNLNTRVKALESPFTVKGTPPPAPLTSSNEPAVTLPPPVSE